MIDELWGESDIVLFIYLFVLILDSICADFPQTFFLFFIQWNTDYPTIRVIRHFEFGPLVYLLYFTRIFRQHGLIDNILSVPSNVR